MSEDTTQLRQFKAWFKADREHSAKWRKAAAEDFEFLAGEQYTDEEKRILKLQLRPLVTFNRTHPIINSISGMEINNRQEVKYFPREAGDAKANELLTEGAKWFRDQADADDEDSDAFLDAAVCGMGWTETSLDMEEEEEGVPTMETVNPLEMYWDKGSRRKNLADAERLWRVRDLPIYRVKDMFPDADVGDMDAAWAKADNEDAEDETQEEADRYEGEDGGDNVTRDQETVTVVHLQYKKREPVWTVALTMPDGQQAPPQEIKAGDLAKLKERAAAIGAQLAVTKKTVLTVKNVFLGSKQLQAGDALCKKHFSFQAVTAYREHKTGLFYGLMRLMKDPQRWANKWMSQALHILNSNAKGGLLMEKGATDDQRKFEADWARPDKINWVEDGALTNKKVQEKGQTAMPAGFFQMMEFAIQSVRDVTGISVELLGMREANQAASLEYQRKQAGMTIIAPLFDNLKRYRRDHGKLMLYIIQNYLADGRLVRIVGEGGAQYVPLALQADAKYDIIVDDQPNSPDAQMMVWQTIVPLIPNLPPAVQLALVDFAPLPTAVKEKIKEAAAGMQQQPNPEAEKIKAETEIKQAELQMKGQDLEARKAETAAKVEMEGAKLAVDREKLDVERQRMAFEAQKMQFEAAEMAGARGDDAAKRQQEERREGDKFMALMKEMGANRTEAAQMLKVISQQTNGVTQAIAQLSAAQDRQTAASMAPRRVMRDANGTPTGIELAQ